MYMGMMGHGRPPGVQHHCNPDACAEVFGVGGGDGEQSLSCGLEQEIIDYRFVLIGDI